jgi:hypothetical protein
VVLVSDLVDCRLFVPGIYPGVDRPISSCDSVVLQNLLRNLQHFPRLPLVTALSIDVVLQFAPGVVRVEV